MHLISSLISGIRGAENGFAIIRSRGTSSLATLYSDYEGTVLVQQSTGVALDANGGSVVYVNQEVDITVQDEDGNPVREFTEMVSAPVVEYQGQSFTGTDYTSGVSATGKPITLQAALDLLYTSFGEPDFKVLFNGSSTLLKNALGSISSVLFDVKSPEYGATGDGATDDTTAVQAAITAAKNAGGGIVLFPNGTYRVTSALTHYAKVSLWGTSSAGSIITTDHSSADTIQCDGATASIGYEEIRGLTIKASQTNSGVRVKLTNAAARLIKISECKIGESNTTGAFTVWADDVAHRLVVEDSDVYTFSASGFAVTGNGNTPWLVLRNSRLYSGAAAFSGALLTGSNVNVSQCEFNLNASSSGTMKAVSLSGGASSTVLGSLIGCRFIPPTGGTSTALALASANAAATAITESGSQFKTGFTTNLSGWQTSSNNPQIQVLSREALKKEVSDNSATLDLDAVQYGSYLITRTSNAIQTLTVTNVPGNGAFFTLMFYQSSGGPNGAITFGSGFVSTTPPIGGGTVANGKIAIYLFRAEYSNGSAVLVPQGTQVITT